MARGLHWAHIQLDDFGVDLYVKKSPCPVYALEYRRDYDFTIFPGQNCLQGFV